MRSRRAWIYVLSVAALLVPAAGIAYLGAVSYRDERGAVDAQFERQNAAARDVAQRITAEVERSLDDIDRAVATRAKGGAAAPTTSLGRFWFWIDANQQLIVPRPAPAAIGEAAGSLDRGAPCAAGRLEDCMRELSTRPSRIAGLRDAQRAEACRGDNCGASWAEAKRLYTQLASFGDTGPAALLGLARLLERAHDPHTQATLAELDRRFADRTYEGVPVRVVTALLRAQAAGPDAVLALADDVLAGRYQVDAIVRLGVLTRIRRQLDRELTAPQRARRAALDEQVAAIRAEARAAAGLAGDVAELARTATPAWRGRPASREPTRTLVYRRRTDGGVIGFAVDNAMLEAAGGPEIGTDKGGVVGPPTGPLGDAVAVHVQPLVLPTNVSPDPSLRALAQVPIGRPGTQDVPFPHVSLWLVNPVGDPDPLDKIIRERSRRHVAYTSGLAIALGLGLLATIRGAARARELARLKSDFVSTVSHELKTPLTSIRMFAEMLEQGVAQGDPSKMARYHGVIVQESQRLGLLIANLLDYAQIERGTRRYTRGRHDIAQLARSAVATFETLRDPEHGPRNPIEIDVSSDAMGVEVEVDRDVVISAMLNLLANAAKYGGDDNSIEVSAGAGDDGAWIAVRDHGPGIPPAEQARIFREFYRAPEAYRSGVEGTGLGLALVKRHIEALGGHVEVASTVGEGATFTIRFPRATAEARELP